MIITLFQTKSHALFEQYEEYVQLLMEAIQSTESSLQTGFFVETIGAIFYYEKYKIPSEKRDEMRTDYFELIRLICELGAGQERDEDMMLYLNSLFSSVAESIKF